MSNLSAELVDKRLEQIKRTIPGVDRVAVLWQQGGSGGSTDKGMLRKPKSRPRRWGCDCNSSRCAVPAELERAFADMTRARAGALTVLPIAMFFVERQRLVDLAARHRLPAIYPSRAYVDAGGLMGYGANLGDLLRRAATYVDKILKGAKPGDLPVQQPTKFELVINLKTARDLGLTIPPSITARRTS